MTMPVNTSRTQTRASVLSQLPTSALVLLCGLYCIIPEPIPVIDDLAVLIWTVTTIGKRLRGGGLVPAAHAPALDDHT